MKKVRAWGGKPKLGQHFLTDRAACERIVEEAHIARHDHVVEIGPGRGALTGLLAAATTHLTLIEADHDLARDLMREYPDASVITEKAEEVDLGALPGPLTVVSNLPYYASVFIFKHLIAHKANIARMVLMFQKEVAQRIFATPCQRHYGSLSVLAAYHWEMEEILTIKPGSFRPPPKVDSTVLRFTPHRRPPVPVEEHRLFELVRNAFGQKRRTLRNNLKGRYEAVALERAMTAAGLGATARAEEIPLEVFAKLVELLGKE